MSNRDVAPRLRALDERVKELEGQRFGVWADNHVAYVRPEEKGDWVKYTDYAVLAERLKACEEERDKLQRENFEMVMTKIPKLQILLGKRIEENDQLTADLAATKKRLEYWNDQCTKAWHGRDIACLHADELRADLERARAEVERLKAALLQQGIAFKTGEVQRLTAALVKERGCEECWKGQSCGTDCHMNDVAIKETP